MITGMVRVRNGEAHIAHCLHSLLRCCDNVVVMNDHSNDRTVEILNSFMPEVHWFTSPFQGLNEARDKSFLLHVIRNMGAAWVVGLDADEVLLDPTQLLINIENNDTPVYSYRILTLWDREDQIRVDGIYAEIRRRAIFRLDATDGIWRQQSPDGPNLHCGSVPTDLRDKAIPCDPEVRVLHYGSMLRSERLRKYYWYLQHDSQNFENEDGYRHAIQGDLEDYPADAVYKHGGPLKLEDWK